MRRSQAIRLLWLMEGERGDYRLLLGGDITPRTVREQVAIGWRNMALDWQKVLGPTSLQLESIERALSLNRALVAGDPQVSVRVSLALDLQALASIHADRALWADDAERTRELEKQQAALVESRSIFAVLKSAGTLPKENSGAILALRDSIDNVERQLSPRDGNR